MGAGEGAREEGTLSEGVTTSSVVLPPSRESLSTNSLLVHLHVWSSVIMLYKWFKLQRSLFCGTLWFMPGIGALECLVKRQNGWCTSTCLENVCFFATIEKFKYLYSALHSQETFPPTAWIPDDATDFLSQPYILRLAAASPSFNIASSYQNPPRPELSTSSGNFTLIINDSHRNFSCSRVHRKSWPTFPPDFPSPDLSLPNSLVHNLRLSHPNIPFITAISSHHG